MLVEAREELNRADGKASIPLAAFGVAAGVFAAAILGGDWTPRDLNRPWEAIWWVGCAIFAAAVCRDFFGASFSAKSNSSPCHSERERESLDVYAGDVG
jgi:hypothetical protein